MSRKFEIADREGREMHTECLPGNLQDGSTCETQA
jgi:hypothetical protein